MNTIQYYNADRIAKLIESDMQSRSELKDGKKYEIEIQYSNQKLDCLAVKEFDAEYIADGI